MATRMRNGNATLEERLGRIEARLASCELDVVDRLDRQDARMGAVEARLVEIERGTRQLEDMLGRQAAILHQADERVAEAAQASADQLDRIEGGMVSLLRRG